MALPGSMSLVFFRGCLSGRKKGRGRPAGIVAAAAVLFVVCEVRGQRMAAGIVVGRSLTGAYADRVYYFNVPPSLFEPGSPWQVWIGRSWSRSGDWVVGGMLETRLTESWSLEVNALFRQLHGQKGSLRLTPDWRPGQKPTAPDGRLGPVVTWQFPVLARYRFEGRNFRPFIALGSRISHSGKLGGRIPVTSWDRCRSWF